MVSLPQYHPLMMESSTPNNIASQPKLVNSVWSLGLSLSGVETRDLRQLVRRCRMALTAIQDTSSPALLQLILPLGFQSPSILSGLLSLSRNSSARSEADLSRHQAALKELVADIGTARSGPIDTAYARRAMASSLLLSIFAIGYCDSTWSHHVRGMTSLARSASRDALVEDVTGDFLLGMCAFSDISAMSIGQVRLSQKCWLAWMMSRQRFNTGTPFTALEVTSGYPETLIDIIAQASELADDQAYCQMPLTHANSVASPSALSTVSWVSRDLETTLKRWTLPELSASMSPFQQLALRTAWDAIRKACFLFLWRGHGFHSNLAEPMPRDRAAESQALVGHILSDLAATLELCRTQKLSIATAIMWPLAVVGCECGHASRRRQDETLQLLHGIARTFSMNQANHLARVLQSLWERLSDSPSFISLEQVCRDMQLVIALI